MSVLSWLFGKKEAENQRRHPRVFGQGISVRIDGHTYYAADASLGGIRLKNCDEDYPEGLTLNVEILLMISRRQEKLPAKAVVWKNNTDGLILRFKPFPQRTRNIYTEYINLSHIDFS